MKLRDTVSQSNITPALLRELPQEILQHDVLLCNIGRWKIGGPATLLVDPRSEEELIHVLSVIRDAEVPHVVVGDGSNLLFDDAGLDGIVIRIGRGLSSFRAAGNGEVVAGAGMWVPCFVRRLIADGLSGANHAIGIPGRLGGLIAMNGGSQRKSIGDNIIQVKILDNCGKVASIDKKDMKLSYRKSVFQHTDIVILSASFRFDQGNQYLMRQEAKAILTERRLKFPKIRQNCGSVFISDPELYQIIGTPGFAIEKAGLKGYRIGDAEISKDHANFIVNHGLASSASVLELIAIARRAVKSISGIAMLAEVRHVLPDATMRPAHESADEMFRTIAS